MKSMVTILLILGISLTLSAIEIEDTFDEWDMVIKGCINRMLKDEHVGMDALRITEKAREGKELTCQEKIILVLEAQELVREKAEIHDTVRKGIENGKSSGGYRDKHMIAWDMVQPDRRLGELLNMEREKMTPKEEAETLVYLREISKALKLFFPECFTYE